MTPRYFVRLTLGDGGVLAFERHQISSATSDVGPLPNSRTHEDTITAVALEASEPSPDIMLDIEFTKGFPGGLHFALAVCYGIAVHSWTKHIPTSYMFALTLVTLLARKRLPVLPNLTSDPKSPVAELHSSVYSYIQSSEKSFWEHNVAAETHEMARYWVVRAIRDEIGIGRNSYFTVDGSAVKTAVLASMVAWVEYLAKTQEREQLVTWDKAWERAWRKEWSRAWEQEWKGSPDIGLSLGSRWLTMAKGDGRKSGRAASRAPISMKKVQEDLLKPAPQTDPTAAIPSGSNFFRNSIGKHPPAVTGCH
jgi:hypothetical protein